MTKPTQQQHPAAGIACEALDAIEHGRSVSSWLEAVAFAIQLDAQHAAGKRVKALAELAQYLADNNAGHLSSEGERLRTACNALEG